MHNRVTNSEICCLPCVLPIWGRNIDIPQNGWNDKHAFYYFAEDKEQSF